MTEDLLKKIPFRKEWIQSIATYATLWMRAQDEQALGLRKQAIAKHLEHQRKSFQKKIKSLRAESEQNELEPDWNYYGSLLQIHFHSQPKAIKDEGHFYYELMDFEKDEKILVPVDSKLNLKQQLERYFHLAKRNKTRTFETSTRIAALEEKLTHTLKAQTRLTEATEISALLALEKELRLVEQSFSHSIKEQKKLVHFSGKQYQSEEGLTILSGKNLNENLELTFKIAKGNDIWLHVKGRPGSHTIILLPPGKSASLETLLDAAHACILHSGGKDWGKTEVDYTFRKHVKKVKNQTEVIYTHNKTLMVTLDPARMKRLFQ